MKKSILWASMFSMLFFSTAFLTSCDDDDDSAPLNIVELAQATPELSTLVAALQQTGLDATLTGAGPFTVFAPTNSAFQQFLADNNFNDLTDVPNDVLTSVLLYHVLGGIEVASSDIVAPIYASTASVTTFGANIFGTSFITNSNTVNINGVADVTTADADASNGIVHIIDAVIPLSTVVTFATADPTFSSLVEALTRPDLTTDFVAVLTGTGPFTVFAPTNQAFQDLLDSNPDWNTLDDIPTAVLEEVLLYHVANGNVRSGDLSNGQTINTLATGESFTIDLSDPNAPAITDASGGSSNIIFVNVQGFNGVVHVVDRVLIPNL